MYLLRVDDLDIVDQQRAEILSAAADFLGSTSAIRIFEEFRFVTSSGYAGRVIDEVEIVLSGKYNGVTELCANVEEFLLTSGLMGYRWHPVLTLSTGWQKYLSLLLFLERTGWKEPVFLFSPFHYLDDELTSSVLSRLAQYERAILLDYDLSRVRSLKAGLIEVTFRARRICPVPDHMEPGSNANW